MTWHDLTLSQYQQLVKLPFDRIDQMEQVDQLKFWYQVHTLITGEKDTPLETLLSALPEYEFLTAMPETLNWQFTADSREWGCNGDISSWTVSQFLNLYDLVNGKSHTEIIDELHKLLSIFYTEIIDGQLQPYDNTERQEITDLIQKHMPADVAYSASLFFYLLSAELLKVTIQRSVEEATQLLQKHLDSSMNSTDYTRLLSMPAMETLLSFQQSTQQTSMTSSSGPISSATKPELKIVFSKSSENVNESQNDGSL